jgi:hypothetical protein
MEIGIQLIRDFVDVLFNSGKKFSLTLAIISALIASCFFTVAST